MTAPAPLEKWKMQKKLASLALLLPLAAAPGAMADDLAGGTLSGTVAATTDYLFRGVSQTRNDPAVQAGLTWTHASGVFVSAWGSNVDFNDGKSNLETDLTVGWSGSQDKISYGASLIYYAYPGVPGRLDYNYWEAQANAAIDLGVVKPSVAVFYSPDFFGTEDKALYITGGLSVPLTDSLKLYANIGYQDYSSRTKNVTDWNGGIVWTLSGFDIDLRYSDTNAGYLGKVAGSRGLVTISRSF